MATMTSTSAAAVAVARVTVNAATMMPVADDDESVLINERKEKDNL